MAYTSLYFYICLAVLLIIYWHIPTKYQKYVILIFSFGFIFSYSSQSMLWVIAIAFLGFFGGKQTKALKYGITTVIVGIFFYLKFSNYLINNLNNWLNLSFNMINIIIPVGLSFYMIQNIMYIWSAGTKYKNEENFLKYLSYVMYFPTIIQGPIARYEDIATSVWGEHDFNQNMFSRGYKLFVWGLFKKMIISGRATMIVNTIFGMETPQSALLVSLGAIFYTIELYMDFSAAVDICRGISYMFGITLPINFDKPYFSTSIKDFWRRWHITLTSFFTEFIYYPLGGSRGSKSRTYFNIIAIFIVSGLWHGVGLNFIVWGLINAIYQIIGDVTEEKRTSLKRSLKDESQLLGKIIGFFSHLSTVSLIAFSWIFFRANGLKHAVSLVSTVVNPLSVTLSFETLGIGKIDLIILIASSMLVFYSEYKNINFTSQTYLENEKSNYALVYILIIIICIFGIYGVGYESSNFIYMGF